MIERPAPECIVCCIRFPFRPFVRFAFLFSLHSPCPTPLLLLLLNYPGATALRSFISVSPCNRHVHAPILALSGTPHEMRCCVVQAPLSGAASIGIAVPIPCCSPWAEARCDRAVSGCGASIWVRNEEPAVVAAVVAAAAAAEQVGEEHGIAVEAAVVRVVEDRGMVVELADDGRSIATCCGLHRRHGSALGSRASFAAPLALD